MRINNLVVALVIILSTACTPNEVSEENKIIWASQGDALSGDPHAVNEGTTISAARKVYDTLVVADYLDFEEQEGATKKELKIVPWLATKWKQIDSTTWQFDLRPDVKWHDDSYFTARDVKFSIDRARASGFKEHLSSIEKVEIINDYRVHIITKHVNLILDKQLTIIFMMSKAWCEEHNLTKPPSSSDAGGGASFAVLNAMGTGPFVLDERVPNDKTVLSKNKNWWGLGEYDHITDNVVYTRLGKPSSRSNALKSKEVHFLLDPPLQDIETLKQLGMNVVETVQDRTIFLGMNQGSDKLHNWELGGGNPFGDWRNPFKDRRVRRAFYQAIDIKHIHEITMHKKSLPAGIITAPSVRGYTKSLDERDFPHDVTAAKDCLEKAGYSKGFTVQLDCPNNRYVNDEAICTAIAAMLEKIGIDVRLNLQQKSEHFPLITQRETDFYLLGWGVPTLDSHYVFSNLVQEGTWNATGFHNSEINNLIEQIGKQDNHAARDKAINSVWKKLKKEIVYLPIHHQYVVWAMQPELDIPAVADNGVRFIKRKKRKD